jgi:uncharacterized Zn finger protein
MVDKSNRSSHPPINNEYWDMDSTEPLPVENGMRAHSQEGSFTKSWWAGRWVRALTQVISATRLVRGKAYARHGQVLDMNVQVGLIVARVQGTRPTPYRVRIEVKILENAEWTRAIEAMSSQAIYAAQLLNGEMPHDIEEVFRAVGVMLFPELRGSLVAECSCPDESKPCKHVAAVCLLVGELLDDDPFLLFTMRGRTKEQIMAALRDKRAEHATAPVPGAHPPQTHALVVDTPLEDCLGTFWQMGSEIETVQVHVAAPAVEMELLKMLGVPSFMGDETLSERLSDVYHTVSRKALDIAFGEH